MTSDVTSTTHVAVRDSAVVLRLRGEIDLVNHEELRASLLAARAKATHLTIDMSDLAFIDNIGGGLILGAVNELRARHARVVLVGAQPSVRRLMFLLGLQDFLAD